MKLFLVPITLKEANEFVRVYHRHHKPVPGAKFCLAVAYKFANYNETFPIPTHTICGVAIVGRPLSRMLDDGWTLEVNRTCTDGTANVNSMLYGACQCAAFALGYKKLITYTIPEEGGTSLRASNWKLVGSAGGGSWSRENRPRVDLHPTQEKLRWEVTV